MKQVIGLFILCIMTVGTFAQDGDRRKAKKDAIKAKKIAFITQAINLTPAEAEKFWPLYNQKNEELKAAKKELRPNFEKKDIESMSDAEVEKQLMNGLLLRERETAIEKKYFNDFKRVISVKQIARLHRAEKRFKVELLENFKKGENGQRRGGQGRGSQRGPR